MEVIDTIGKIIGFIAVLVVIGYGFSFIMNSIAKAGNIRYTKRGRTIYSPSEFDSDIDQIKRAKAFFVDKIKESKKVIARMTDEKQTTSEKIRLLSELEELKNQKIVSDSEYQQIRSEILK